MVRRPTAPCLVDCDSSAPTPSEVYHDTIEGFLPVARCRDLRKAARMIDDHITATTLLGQVYGLSWQWWRSRIQPILGALTHTVRHAMRRPPQVMANHPGKPGKP